MCLLMLFCFNEPFFCCVSAVLKAVSNVNDIIAPALVGKVSELF